MAVPSFKDRLDAVGGFGPGFELLRLVLASGVVVWHALVMTAASEAEVRASPLWLIGWGVVPMFFVLSGFLVTQSALRLSRRDYLLNRIARIVPALAVDIVLCALLIGPLFTVLPLGDYLRAPEFARYFLNIVGWVHYFLPGVFEGSNVGPTVNGSLWTVPYELGCYGVMALLVTVGMLRGGGRMLLLVGGWLVAALVIGSSLQPLPATFGGHVVNFLFVQQGARLVPFFLAGSAIYLVQARLPFDGLIAMAAAAALLAGTLLVDGGTWWASPLVPLLTCAPMAYLVVYLGLSRLPRPPSLHHGDYSYGIYLYHFPLLQVIMALYPVAAWWQLLGLAVVPVIGVAMLSWHAVERPALALRRRFSLVGARVA